MTSDRAIAERQSRLEILQQLNAEGEGLTEGSQAVLRGLDDPAHILPALTGALASLIEVEEEFIPAIEAALGRNLHAIVLQMGARELRSSPRSPPELGQTALIVPGRAPPPRPRRRAARGAIAWATEKCNAPTNLETIVRQLLARSRWWPISTGAKLEREFRLSQFATPGRRFCLRQGRYLWRANKRGESFLFARKAQIASLAADHRALSTSNLRCKQSAKKFNTRLDEKTERLEQIREEHQTARGDHSATALQVTAIERELHEAGASRRARMGENDARPAAQQLRGTRRAVGR